MNEDAYLIRRSPNGGSQFEEEYVPLGEEDYYRRRAYRVTDRQPRIKPFYCGKMRSRIDSAGGAGQDDDGSLKDHLRVISIVVITNVLFVSLSSNT